MNERIRELAVQARLLTGWPNGEVEYQKFAELIVRECADVGSKLSMAHPEAIRYQIKKHFGVEDEQK